MEISVFGLGYVGAVSSACLADEGHRVVGVDPNRSKVESINSGAAPIVEPGLAQLIEQSVSSGLLRATSDVSDAIRASEISFVCVGTPSQHNGNLDLKYVRRVCEEIGGALKDKDGFHVIVVRSTMLPGSMRATVIPALEQSSGKRVGEDIGLCINPEFLREGSAISDYRSPPKTVIGESDSRAGDALTSLYSNLKTPLIRTSIESAELVKYADNAWHAVKVTFANEIGNIAKELDIDGHEVMNIFCQDQKLNLSPYYLKPGFAFGGSCLPKDLRALNFRARSLDLASPLLGSVLESNALQVERALKMILGKNKKKVSIFGFAFKGGTDDLRESPMVEVIERLIGKGLELRLYDESVSVSALTGANRDYILNHIPHISKLMRDNFDEVMDFGDVLVIGNNSPSFASIVERKRSGQVVIDLVRIVSDRIKGEGYDGICW